MDRLERAFVCRTGDMPADGPDGKYRVETTPLKIGDQLVMCSAKNILIAIDAATGEENWRFDPRADDDAIPYSASWRGVSAYAAPELADDAPCKTRVIEATRDARLIAVDLRTGRPCANFDRNGQVDLWQGIGGKEPGRYGVTAPSAIVRVVVTGAQVKDGQAEDAPSGVIRGSDAVTGAFLWAWDLGRPGEYDPPPEGGTNPAILRPSKQGDIYVLDRATGEPLTPLGEIEAPDGGGVEPDFLSPAQAVSEWQRLRKDDLVERDMWGSPHRPAVVPHPVPPRPLPRLLHPALADRLWCSIRAITAGRTGARWPSTQTVASSLPTATTTTTTTTTTSRTTTACFGARRSRPDRTPTCRRTAAPRARVARRRARPTVST